MIRLFDLIISIIAIVLWLPFFLIISVVIFLQDFKNPFFIQRRVSKDLKVFNVYKFRTMELEHRALKGSMTQKNDPRVTTVGKFLRKTTIDELPQLFNVLKGDMSIVGPRPYMEWQIKQFDSDESWVRRHSVKPGITGLVQINGRSSLNQEERTKLDFEFIENYSVKLYFEIIFKTFTKYTDSVKNAN